MIARVRRDSRRRLAIATATAVLGLSFILSPLPREGVRAEDEAESSCIPCHRNPDLLVQNKKLYDYFNDWSSSVHRQEGVGCEDCHGGRPEASDKDAAHGRDISPSDENSAVNFRNISETCGECHDDILDGFRKSEHFKHVLPEEKEDEQGPTCVTCHGSMNVEILNVTSVAEACARCHNDETDNHPENPQKARTILNRLLSMHRTYRYIAANATPGDTSDFVVDIGERLHAVSVTWHTFDLEKIEDDSMKVLALLKAKRGEMRTQKRAQKH